LGERDARVFLQRGQDLQIDLIDQLFRGHQKFQALSIRVAQRRIETGAAFRPGRSLLREAITPLL
jgi:hypothetical protein